MMKRKPARKIARKTSGKKSRKNARKKATSTHQRRQKPQRKTTTNRS